jgi:hypothetical protein
MNEMAQRDSTPPHGGPEADPHGWETTPNKAMITRTHSMPQEPSRHTRSSTRTTGNDPVEGADPGGTRSTKPGDPDKSRPRQKNPKATQSVVSGDRNTSAESRSPRKPNLPSS